MEMHEFKEMCEQIRIAEAALGRVSFDLTDAQKKEREHSRSLFVVSDIKKGESFSPENVRSIRPDLDYIQSIMIRLSEKQQ